MPVIHVYIWENYNRNFPPPPRWSKNRNRCGKVHCSLDFLFIVLILEADCNYLDISYDSKPLGTVRRMFGEYLIIVDFMCNDNNLLKNYFDMTLISGQVTHVTWFCYHKNGVVLLVVSPLNLKTALALLWRNVPFCINEHGFLVLRS